MIDLKLVEEAPESVFEEILTNEELLALATPLLLARYVAQQLDMSKAEVLDVLQVQSVQQALQIDIKEHPNLNTIELGGRLVHAITGD